MRNNRIRYIWFIIAAISMVSFSCNKFAGSLLTEKSPHQKYEEQLEKAGLNGSVLFNKWVEAAESSLRFPSSISIPYQEEAFFAGNNPNAIGYLFEARNGEQLQIDVSPQSLDSTRLFIDLFENNQDSTQQHKHLHSAETDSSSLSYIIKNDGEYILRIQPELLSDISFALRITAEPSLSNPVSADAKQNIGSFFGVDRDAGARRHEGIDIFADRLTPALSAADGIISRVGTNNLGGKIVFLSLRDRSLNLYYAHLDSQTVSTGQSVVVGDTLGLIGNTGNARTTPPHLHFGIYTNKGAIDPLPFVRPGKSSPSKITADTKRIGDTVRAISKSNEVAINTPLFIEAAALNGYRVITPNKTKIFIPQNQVTTLYRPFKTITLNQTKVVYKEPNALAAKVTEYSAGENIKVVGSFNDFYLVEQGLIQGWIKE